MSLWALWVAMRRRRRRRVSTNSGPMCQHLSVDSQTAIHTDVLFAATDVFCVCLRLRVCVRACVLCACVVCVCVLRCVLRFALFFFDLSLQFCSNKAIVTP
eukprot:Opistho-2@61804